MKEEINIYDGRGVIHLKGSPSETFLYVKKEPRIACFHAEVGTVWRYQMGREIDENLMGENYKYEALVKSGKVKSNVPLSVQFNHLTRLLTNGHYELHLCEFSWKLQVLPAISKDDKNPYYDVYGGMAGTTATQTYSDKQVIAEYKEAMKKGIRPIVILIKIKDSWVIYILDGHHKMQAYKELEINPKALLISKLDYKGIEQDEAIKTMKKLGMTNSKWFEIYKKEKKSKAQERNYYDNYSEGLETYFK